ncbi:MAG TPA: hypothetical protein QGF58_01520 [Myxococcota bacterium]|nr:hypothetical protein [Myxococcota bacterium]
MERRAFLKLGALGCSGALILGAVPSLGAVWLSTEDARVIEVLAASLFAGVPLGDIDVVGAFTRSIAPLPRSIRWQARGLLRALEWEPVMRYGSRLSRLDPTTRDDFLVGMATSPLYPRRLALHGAKQLLAMAVYQHDATWKLMGYDGPLLPEAR